MLRAVLRYSFRPVEWCDMCGSTDFRLLGLRLNRSQGLRPKRLDGIAVSVKQCRHCDLIFADPQPIPDKPSDHYGVPPEDYWGELEEWSTAYFSREIATAKRLLSFKPGMAALDIGAGTGLAMRSLINAGFDTWGIEPSRPFYDRIIEKIDPARLKLTTLEDADFPEQSFDFITFGAVLEHLCSPGAALAKAVKWLRPNGIIHAEVPNAGWTISRLVNLYYRLSGTNFVTNVSPMHLPFHLYEFSPRSFLHYDIAEHYIDVCSIPHFPKAVHPLLRWWMKRTNSGMQLTVFLQDR